MEVTCDMFLCYFSIQGVYIVPDSYISSVSPRVWIQVKCIVFLLFPLLDRTWYYWCLDYFSYCKSRDTDKKSSISVIEVSLYWEARNLCPGGLERAELWWCELNFYLQFALVGSAELNWIYRESDNLWSFLLLFQDMWTTRIPYFPINQECFLYINICY